MSRKAKYVVVGFTAVRSVTNKQTGELYNAINISVNEVDANYTGRRACDYFLRCKPGDYSWLREGMYVDPEFSNFGNKLYLTGFDPVED